MTKHFVWLLLGSAAIAFAAISCGSDGDGLFAGAAGTKATSTGTSNTGGTTSASTASAGAGGASTGSGSATTTTSSSCGDTETDPQNCGACGHSCPAAMVCIHGACSPSMLLRYYPFTGDTKDQGTAGIDLVNEGATLTLDRNGTPDRAFHFDGVASYMKAPGTGLPIGNEARTITAWVRPSGNAVTENISVGGFLTLGAGNCTAKQFGLARYVPIGGTPTNLLFWGACKDQNSGLALPVGVWSFVAVRWDGAGTLTQWVGGASFVKSGFGTLATGASNLWVGVETGSDTATFAHVLSGDLDEIRIYGRALSDAEVAAVAQLP